MVLVPAYGREYETAEAMLADWEQGLDFRIKGGSYVSIRDIQTLADYASTVTLYDMRTRVSANAIPE